VARTTRSRRLRAAGNALFVAVALAHALLTWSPAETAIVFAGSVLLALPGEAVVVRAGLLEHHTGPKVAGVPLPILVAWPAVVYAFVRASGALTGGPTAIVFAAGAATLFDAVVDPIGVRRGEWSYPESAFSEPRFRGVPWWNFAGWFLLVGAVSALVFLA